MNEIAARRWIREFSFGSRMVGRIGAELEWVLVDDGSPGERVNPQRPDLAELTMGRLPGGGVVSFEPGGQIEISSQPQSCVEHLVDALILDVGALTDRLSAAGIRLAEFALDPREPHRVVDHPRYEALERHYARFGSKGRSLMCNAASIQVNVDCGDESQSWTGLRRRWRLANALGPVLVAIFANSPGTGESVWRSHREMMRLQTDPLRIFPLAGQAADPYTQWTDRCLDCFVVGVTSEVGEWIPPEEPFTMRQWLRGSGRRPVHRADLERHLKTVIPPVRPCGHLELRMIDQQKRDDWAVPILVVSALLDDPDGSDAVAKLLDSRDLTCEDWAFAAMLGMTAVGIRELGFACLQITLDVLKRRQLPRSVIHRVASFAERYTYQGLSPADGASVMEERTSVLVPAVDLMQIPDDRAECWQQT